MNATLSLGLNAAWHNDVSASVRLRDLALRADVFNLFDCDDDDIAYYYASRLPGEPSEGVEDIHFHPLEPRTLRASVTMFWK